MELRNDLGSQVGGRGGEVGGKVAVVASRDERVS
jgi:hypothetical protein